MAGNEKRAEDKPKVTERLIDLINEMSLEQQLALLNQLDRKQYHKGRADHRRSRRIQVAYKIDGTDYHGFIHDISAAGVYIGTENSHAVGEKVILRFSLLENKKLMKVSGRIVRIGEDGFAVDFRLSTEAEKQ